MRWVALMAGLTLAACQGEADQTDQTGRDDPCNAEAYSDQVGSNIAAVQFPAGPNIRVIGPDSAVTMDFLPERLNVRIDENGTITALDCG